MAAGNASPFAFSFHSARKDRRKVSQKMLACCENPFLIGDAVVACSCVPGLGVPAQQQIAEKRAQVESDWAVESEFRIDHARVIVGDHHRPGMKIPVNERLGFIEKFLPEACRGHFERPIAAKVRDNVVKLRGSVTIALADEVGIRKNQIYGDAHERLICREQRHPVHLTFERSGEVGREEAGAGDVLAHIARRDCRSGALQSSHASR